MDAPDYLFGPEGKVLDEIMDWASTELKGSWIGIRSLGISDSQVDFQLEKDMIYFKLRWIGA